MRGILLLLVPAAVALLHVMALFAGRRGGAKRHTFAFYSGLLGLLLLPAVPLTFLLAGPLPVVGPVSPGFAMSFNVVGIASLVLAATSAILAPYAAFRREHPEHLPRSGGGLT